MTTDPTTPVAETARRLVAAGWSPLPLPAHAKTPPPPGFTGYAGRYSTVKDVARWDWDGNIAIRLPPDVAGVDVDVYHQGGEGLEQLVTRFGVELPDTVWSTSRDDGSGIALFRVPNGTTLATDPAQGVDMIQAHHRYLVVAPSIHPEGRTYRWVDEQSGDDVDDPPHPGDLPDLPWAWIEGLAVVKTGAAAAAGPDEVRAFLEQHTANSRPAALKGVRRRLVGPLTSRHDTLVETACWALREAAAGLYPADAAVDVLHQWWIRVMDDPSRRDGGEFGAVLRWAVAQIAADPDRVETIATKPSTSTRPPDVDPATGEITDPRNLPDSFWTARPSLEHIRAAAHAQTRCADAVLLFVLARVAALTPPSIVLPAIAGGIASLNFLGGIVSNSGGGKTTAGDVARALLPIDRKDVVADVPPGSGEGLTELYFEMVDEEDNTGKPRKVKRQTKSAAFIYLDEGQALAEMGGRRGATLLPTLRSAWSGAVIGQSNATLETHRVLKAHTYRMAIMVGFQLDYAAGLIDDAPGGTPQRFIFATATDPTVPTQTPPWPGELTVTQPTVITGKRQEIGFDPDIAAGIRTRQLLTTRGDYIPDPLDTHADLARMKIAALLAILDDRHNVDTDDWELAGLVMRTSRAVRAWVIEEARQKARALEATRTVTAVGREMAILDAHEQRALRAGARAIARRVHRDGEPTPRRELHKAVDSKSRAVVTLDQMIDFAITEHWIVANGDGWKPGESRPA